MTSTIHRRPAPAGRALASAQPEARNIAAECRRAAAIARAAVLEVLG